MKRHGLWQFHRAINSNPSKKIKWWLNLNELKKAKEEYERNSSENKCSGKKTAPYRDAEKIIRCTFRFARRFNLSKDIKTWNETVMLISKRMCFNHRSTTAALIDTTVYKKNKNIIFKNEFEIPKPKFSNFEILFRLKRRKKYVDQNIICGSFCLVNSVENPCFICNTPEYYSIIKNYSEIKISKNFINNICLHNRCQAIYKVFPKEVKTKKNYSLPLINVLIEIAKNEKSNDINNKNFRGLEKHFIFNVRQVYKWRDRFDRSKNRSKNSRQPIEISGG